MVQAPDVSIIIVNWNALELTCAALESIRTHVGSVSYDVIVIDNGSTRDASATELPRRAPWVHFVANPDNRGFSKANNQGVRLARGRYILLLNQDTLQVEDAIGAAVRYMDAHPDVGALGIEHLNHDEARSHQPSAFPFPRPSQDLLALMGLGRLDPDTGPVAAEVEADVDWVCGSFLLLRRACLAEVGELDERFFVYAEDIDWCCRARRAGWKVRYWPGARMIHLGAASRPFISDKTFMHFRSHLTYVRKNHSLVLAALFYGAMTARLSSATLRQVLRLATGRGSVADVSERLSRQLHFALLRPSRTGLR